VTVAGRPEPPLEEIEEAHYQPVGEGYFATVGARLVAGRPFTAADRPGAPPVAVVNQAFVRRYFPAEEPVGEAIRVYGVGRRIVGVVADVRFLGLAVEPQPTLYLPVAQNPQPSFTVVAKAAGDPSALLPEIRALMADLDPDLALFDAAVVEEALAGSLAQRRFTLVLLGAFAAVALALAAIGIYGVLSYLVSQRTREIGVRMAVGATPRQVLLLIVGGGLPLVAAGLALGLAASLGSGRLLAGLLYGVGATDPPTLAAVAAAVAVAALAACWRPARRAARIDPQAALRPG
jgi:predicted permease